MNDIKSKLDNLTNIELKHICKYMNVDIGSRKTMIINLLKPLVSFKMYDADTVKTISDKLDKLMQKCWPHTNIQFLMNLRYKWYVIFDENTLIAALAVDNDNVIWNLCVDPEYRKQGHASTLIQQVIADLCKRHRFVALYVKRFMNQNYQNLIDFYQKHGFKIYNTDFEKSKLIHMC